MLTVVLPTDCNVNCLYTPCSPNKTDFQRQALHGFTNHVPEFVILNMKPIRQHCLIIPPYVRWNTPQKRISEPCHVETGFKAIRDQNAYFEKRLKIAQALARLVARAQQGPGDKPGVQWGPGAAPLVEGLGAKPPEAVGLNPT